MYALSAPPPKKQGQSTDDQEHRPPCPGDFPYRETRESEIVQDEHPAHHDETDRHGSSNHLSSPSTKGSCVPSPAAPIVRPRARRRTRPPGTARCRDPCVPASRALSGPSDRAPAARSHADRTWLFVISSEVHRYSSRDSTDCVWWSDKRLVSMGACRARECGRRAPGAGRRSGPFDSCPPRDYDSLGFHTKEAP